MFFSFCAFSTPTWMWVGTYSITNGPCNLDSLTDAADNGNYFYNAACQYHPNGPTPVRSVNAVNSDVTIGACQSGDRESCDFIVMSGHGCKRGMAINQNDLSCPYHDFWTSEMAFGTSYLRWAFLTGCNTLFYDNFNDFFYGTGSWEPAFKGIQCVLGYGSAGYIFPNQCTMFWQLWTSGYSIWNAYREATRYWIYQNGGLGIRPAIVTSRNASGHYFWDDSYSQATSTQAVTWPVGTQWQVYGTPRY